jgi:acyl-CoA oxidase
VLTLQTGRYLLTCFKAAVKDKKTLPEGVSFINKIPEILSAKISGDPVSLENIEKAFDSVSANLLNIAGMKFLENVDRGEDAALEQVSLLRFRAAKAHCQGYLFHRFRRAIEAAPGDMKEILSDLCQLYGLYTIHQSAGPFLQFGFYKPEHIAVIQERAFSLLEKLRSQVIPLSDAFNFTDYVVNSSIGCYDGDVYRRFFEHTVRQNPIGNPHPYYQKVIKPVLMRNEPDDQEHQPIKLGDEDLLAGSQGPVQLPGY